MTQLLLVALLSVMTPRAFTVSGMTKPDRDAGAQQVAPAAPAALRIDAVKFEPVGQGRNVVRVTITNTGQANAVLALDIYTRSPDYGRGIGWGTQFPETVGAADTKELRFVYWVYGPVTDKTSIRLSFYNPPSPDTIERRFLFDRRQYTGRDLPRATAASVQPAARAADSTRAEVVELLRTTQQDMKAKRYARAWQSFSKDLCAVSHCKTEADFIQNIASEKSPMRPFVWPVDRFLRFDPGEAWYPRTAGSSCSAAAPTPT